MITCSNVVVLYNSVHCCISCSFILQYCFYIIIEIPYDILLDFQLGTPLIYVFLKMYHRTVKYCYSCTVLPPILWPRPISISTSLGTVKWSFELIFLWIMIMFMVFSNILYCRMYNYMYLCTNKGKNMTKIAIRLIIPILRIQILRPAMLTNFTQNWREHCIWERENHRAQGKCEGWTFKIPIFIRLVACLA